MKTMKNKILSSLLLLSLIVILNACGNTASTIEPGADLSSLGNEILDEVDFEDDLAVLNENLASNYLYQVNFTNVSNYQIYAGGGFIAEEIILIEAVDAEAAEAVLESINTRIDDLKTSYGNYTPEELENLEDPAIVTNGNYVFFVISSENEEAESTINEWILEQNN